MRSAEAVARRGSVGCADNCQMRSVWRGRDLWSVRDGMAGTVVVVGGGSGMGDGG